MKTPIIKDKKGQYGVVGAGMVTGIIFLIMALVIGLVVYSKFMGSMNNSFGGNNVSVPVEEEGLFNDVRGYAAMGFGLLALGILVAAGSFIMALFRG